MFQRSHTMATRKMLNHPGCVPEASVHPAVWPGSLVSCLVTRSSDSHHSSHMDNIIHGSQSCRACCQCIQLKSLLSLSFTATLQSGSSPLCSFSRVLRSLLKYTLAWTFRMHSFKIYGKWSVQTNKPTNKHRYTHVRNAVTLVWCSLRLAPIIVYELKPHLPLLWG